MTGIRRVDFQADVTYSFDYPQFRSNVKQIMIYKTGR
jgi:hypothetical protein